jgi:hypothetical protein
MRRSSVPGSVSALPAASAMKDFTSGPKEVEEAVGLDRMKAEKKV